jgi:alpha-L-fucosidase
VRSFVDIVSKNGNLLLDVGPMADGTIPDLQRERLVGLGQWLAVNGEAIFGTRPWLRAEGRTTGGTAVRFTHKGDALYAVLLDRPQGAQVTLPALYAKEGAAIRLLGVPDALSWRQDGEQLTISLPELLPEAPAYALRIAPWVEQGA